MILQAAENYLHLRRRAGFKLEVPGRLVRDFARFCDNAGAAYITVDLALTWATLPTGAQPSWYHYRLGAVRGFAAHLHAIDAHHQVPPANLLPRRRVRPVPYLFTPEEIAALIRTAATTLRPPLHAATYTTLIGLLAVTGMRPGEAVGLDRDNVDLTSGLLTVVGKYGKHRQLALHPTTVTALSGYCTLRDRLCPRPAANSFLVSTVGTRLLPAGVRRTFRTLARRAGIQPRSGRCRPQPIGLRHSFAVNTLIDWYRTDVDVNARLPVLSTWMGHATPASTYYYLHAVPHLLALAAQRQQQATRRSP